MKKKHIVNILIASIALIFSFKILAGYDYWIQFYNKESYDITITPLHSYCIYAFSKQSFTVPAGQQTLSIELRSNNSGACVGKSAHAQYAFNRTDGTKASLGWINFWMNYHYFTSDTDGSCLYISSVLCSDNNDDWVAHGLDTNDKAGVTFNYWNK